MSFPTQTGLVTASLGTLLSASSLMAQSLDTLNLVPPSRVGATNRPPAFQAQIELSRTASGKAEFLGQKAGNSGASSASVNLFAPLALNDDWILPIGIASQNLELGSAEGLPVPNRIHTLSLSTGLGHRLNDNWMLMGIVNPALYKFDDVGGNDTGISGGINAIWRYTPNLTLRFGVMVSPDSDLKLLPMIGAEWQIDDQWLMRIAFPQPRLIYQPVEHWSFYFGASMVGTTFRAEESLGNTIELSRYNDALGTYRDIRVGTGASYQFNRSFSLEVEAGYSVSRQIRFTRIEETVKFAPSPYARVGLRIGF